MKIRSCYIENFGKLSNYSMDFSDGMNTVCAENGWGKSTFAAFLRAMFYGLEGERKRKLEENERKRFKPWQGGVFGGRLVFELNEKTYEILRIFGSKESEDEFELRDYTTNLHSDDFSKNIGEEIFKINRESFLRTIFIGQKECETVVTDDINAKIGNLADQTNDMKHYDAAYARLTEVMNKLTPTRMTGTLAKRKEEIATYERMVQSANVLDSSIRQIQERLEKEEENYLSLKEKIKENGKLQARASEMKSCMVKKAEWERLQEQVLQKETQLQNLRTEFPGEIPGLEEINEMISVSNQFDKIQEKLKTYQLGDEQKKEMLASQAVFGNEEIENERWQEQIQKANRLHSLLRNFGHQSLTKQEEERFFQLETRFEGETETAQNMMTKWNDHNIRKTRLESEQASMNAFRSSMEALEKTHDVFKIQLFGVLGIVAGMVLFFVNYLFGGLFILLGIGACVLAACRRKKQNRLRRKRMAEYEQQKQNIEKERQLLRNTEQEVANYCKHHGKLYSERTVEMVLQEIARESFDYQTLKEKKQSIQEQAGSDLIQELRSGLQDFLATYHVFSDDTRFLDAIYSLREKYARYQELKEKNACFETNEEEMMLLKERLVCFFKRYQFSKPVAFFEQICAIKEAVTNYINCENMVSEAKKQLADFMKHTDEAVFQQFQTVSSVPDLEFLNHEIFELTQQLEQSQMQIRRHNQDLERLQEELDEREENKKILEELRTLQTEEQKKYHAVVLARTKLESAKNAMTARYSAPILRGFQKYYRMFTGKMDDSYKIDANSRITVEALGKQRDTEALSAGYRDLIGICLRMAFVDAMYSEEKPVIIMDDPFVNLDDRKIQASKAFLDEVGKEYQIIYFTCSAAR